MRDAGQSDIETVTLGFTEFKNSAADEFPLASEVAKVYGTTHAQRFVSQNEFDGDFPRIFAAMDQPSIDGINTWFVSKAAHELGLKVVVSGLGGDELFGGYPSFSQVPRLASIMRRPGALPFLPRATRRVASAFLAVRPRLSQKWAGVLEYGGSVEGAYLLRRGLFMPWELPSVMGKEMAREGLRQLDPLGWLSGKLQPRPGSDFGKLAVLELTAYMGNQLLRDSDWASMAHSLELRTPLVDSVVLRDVAPHVIAMARDRINCKQLLAAAPKRPLPEAVTSRAKTGLSTPIAVWLRSAIDRNAGHSSQRVARAISETSAILSPAGSR